MRKDGECSDERRWRMFSGTHLLAVQVAVNFWWNRLNLSAYIRELKGWKAKDKMLKTPK